MSGKRLLVLAFVGLVLTRPGFAQDGSSRFWVFLKVGHSFKIGPGPFKEMYDDDKAGRQTGVGLMFRLSPNLSVRSEFLKGYFSNIPTEREFFPGTYQQSMRFLSWTNELKYSFFGRAIRPYLTLGGGIAFLNYMYWRMGWPYSKFMLAGSAGIDFRVTKRFLLFVEARYVMVFHKYFSGTENIAFAPLSFGISYNL